MRSYAVVGMGAVGGLYGGRLAAAGHPVHFLVRSSIDEIRRDGLHVQSVDGDIDLPHVSVYDRAVDVPPVDVVLVSIKTTANDTLGDVLPPLVRDGTTVVLLQNGLGGEEQVTALAPRAVVLGGLCFVCSEQVAPGRIRHVDYGRVTLAEHRPDGRPAGVTPAVEAVAADFSAADVNVAPQDDLVLARWKKLVWNIPYNGLSVVLNGGTDELMADPAARSLVHALMDEVVAGAAACGRAIDAGFVDRMLVDTDAMTPYRTSMKLDFDARRPLELDAIYAVPTLRAREGGAPMIRTEALGQELRFLDTRNRA